MDLRIDLNGTLTGGTANQPGRRLSPEAKQRCLNYWRNGQGNYEIVNGSLIVIQRGPNQTLATGITEDANFVPTAANSQFNYPEDCLYSIPNNIHPEVMTYLDAWRPSELTGGASHSRNAGGSAFSTSDDEHDNEFPLMWRDDPWNSYLYKPQSEGNDAHVLFSWHWLECCTDGVIIGPLPRRDYNPWDLVFKQRCHKMEGLEQGTRIYQWSPYEEKFKHLDVPMHQSCVPDWDAKDADTESGYDGIKVECMSCDVYCAEFTNCGECTANVYCGWNDHTGTCEDVSNSTRIDTSYIPDKIAGSVHHYTSSLTTDSRGCSVCSNITNEFECTTQAGCGWAYFKTTGPKCVSGTADYPSCTTGEGCTTVQWEPPSLCYVASYNEKKAFAAAGHALAEKSVINPVTSYPEDHPKVADGVAPRATCKSRRRELTSAVGPYETFQGGDPETFRGSLKPKRVGLDPEGLDADGVDFNANQPCAFIPGDVRMLCEDGRGHINADEFWSKSGNQGCDGDVEDVLGAVAFYAYGYPLNYSSNTGNERHNAIVSHLLVDAEGDVYMIVTIDKAHDGSGGHLDLDMETTGIPAKYPVQFFDDPQEYEQTDRYEWGVPDNNTVGGSYTYSSAFKNGTFSFEWTDYGGDGFVFGPMPVTEWSINMAIDGKNTRGLDSFIVGSYNVRKNDVDYALEAPIKKAQHSWGGVQIEGMSCTKMCQMYTDCEECSKDENCKFSAPDGCVSKASYVYEFAHLDAYGNTLKCQGASKAPEMKVMVRNETELVDSGTVTIRVGAQGLDERCPCSSQYGVFIVVYSWNMTQVALAENIPVREGKRYTFVDVPGLANSTWYNYYAYVCLMQGTLMRDECSPAARESGKLNFNFPP